MAVNSGILVNIYDLYHRIPVDQPFDRNTKRAARTAYHAARMAAESQVPFPWRGRHFASVGQSRKFTSHIMTYILLFFWRVWRIFIVSAGDLIDLRIIHR